MARARASALFLLTVLAACHDPSALVLETPVAAAGRAETQPEETAAAMPPAPVGEIRADRSRRTLKARWSPLAQAVLGHRFVQELDGADPALRLELELQPDRAAIETVASGDAALAIVAAELTPYDLERGLVASDCGRYAPVLIVNGSNPVRSLTARAMREAATGQVRNWLALGGRPGATVELALPEAQALRQRAAALLITGDRFAGNAVKLDGERAVLEFVRSRPNALGLVSASLLADGPAAAGVRALAIDGVLPDATGYRWQTALSVVARVARDEVTARLIARARRFRT